MNADTLRVRAFRWEPYALPFRESFATAGDHVQERRGFVVRLQDQDGTWGVGEAAPLPAFGGETLAACEARLVHWSKTLPGRSVTLPAEPATLLDAPFVVAQIPDDVTGADFSSVPSACHALECALLDLAARRAGLPLSRWLAQALGTGLPPASVAVNATLGATGPAKAAAAARAAVSEGVCTLKVKVGVGGEAADEGRLRAVREAVGPAVRLRIDANGAWTCEDAVARLTRWAPLGLEYAEQPVPANDLASLSWLNAHAPVPIAADESVRGPADATRLLERHAAAVLVLKPMLLGGPFVTLAIARQALAQGVAVVVTTVLEGIYGRLAALHVAAVVAALHAQAGLPGPPPACGLATGGLLARDLASQPPTPHGGVWKLPRRSGLGLA